MRKFIIPFLAILMFSSCASQKMYIAFSKSDEITEIAIMEYVPIYLSFLPEPRSIVIDMIKITELIAIINKSLSVEKTRAAELMGGPGIFDFEIRCTGKSLSKTEIYVWIDDGKAYISDLALYDQTQKEYKLYQIRTEDLSAFLGYINLIE